MRLSDYKLKRKMMLFFHGIKGMTISGEYDTKIHFTERETAFVVSF